MHRLVDYYLTGQNYASKRTWQDWPFHKIYNFYEVENGSISCQVKWRNIVDSHMKEILSCSDFDKLFYMLYELAKSVKGIGTLHIYDTATCFLLPSRVYLQCGAREAARAMGVTDNVADVDVFINQCPELARLTPVQLEDFLCIYKDVFKGVVTVEDRLSQLAGHFACNPCIYTIACGLSGHS